MPEFFTIPAVRLTVKELKENEENVSHAGFRLVFSKGVCFCDEGFKFINGSLFSSSYTNGIAGFDEEKNEYVHHFHGLTQSLGDLKFAETQNPSVVALFKEKDHARL